MNLQSGKNTGVAATLTRTLFIIYLIGLSWIIVFKLGVPFVYGWHTTYVNLVPFKRPQALEGDTNITEMLLNVLAFIPFGVYTAILYKKHGWGVQVCWFFCVSLLYETSQYVLKCGMSDITDVINNTLGGAIGLLLYKTFEKACGSIKAQKITNIVALTGTLLTVIVILLLKINKLWLFKQPA